MKHRAVISDPEILGGEPVFAGTRVPVRALFDYLKAGSVDEFLKGYPHISRAMVNDVLAEAAQRMTRRPRRSRHETTA